VFNKGASVDNIHALTRAITETDNGKEGTIAKAWLWRQDENGKLEADRIDLLVNKHYGNLITVYVVYFDGITMLADTSLNKALHGFYAEIVRRWVAQL
jgi:hypothetical protein